MEYTFCAYPTVSTFPIIFSFLNRVFSDTSEIKLKTSNNIRFMLTNKSRLVNEDYSRSSHILRNTKSFIYRKKTSTIQLGLRVYLNLLTIEFR